MHASKNTLELWGLLAGIILMLAVRAPAAEPAGQGRVTRKADDASFISIQFADKHIPEIHVTGVSKPEPYGTYLGPEEQRAADRVAVLMPPPELAAYALEWDIYDNGGYAQQGLAGYSWDYESPLLHNLLQLSPPYPYPLYNTLEYNAQLAEWRRALERAALHSADLGQRPIRSRQSDK
jgi:hypothetical protein